MLWKIRYPNVFSNCNRQSIKIINLWNMFLASVIVPDQWILATHALSTTSVVMRIASSSSTWCHASCHRHLLRRNWATTIECYWNELLLFRTAQPTDILTTLLYFQDYTILINDNKSFCQNIFANFRRAKKRGWLSHAKTKNHYLFLIMWLFGS